MKIKEISKRVKEILELQEEAKDNDNLLISMMWEEDLEQINPCIYEIPSFLRLLEEGKLTSFESIRRCRQLLQETYPDLRGVSYEARHHKAIEVKQEIHEEKFPMILDSKYERINSKILKTLKKGDEVYFTHHDIPKDSKLYNAIHWANQLLTLGKKYIVEEVAPTSIIIIVSDNEKYHFAPEQFSIKKRIIEA